MSSYQITNFIEQNGIKKSAVSDRLGITYWGLCLKLRGDHDFKASEILELANWWGVTTDYLLGRGEREREREDSVRDSSEGVLK